MKSFSLLAIAVFISAISYSQSNPFTGNYAWAESGNRVSLIINSDNSIKLYTGTKQGALSEGDYRTGTYALEGSMLRISWSDGAKEKKTLQLVGGNQLKVILPGFSPAGVNREYLLDKQAD